MEQLDEQLVEHLDEPIGVDYSSIIDGLASDDEQVPCKLTFKNSQSN